MYISQDMKKTQKENILNQVSFSKTVWTKVIEVIEKFETRSLKGSKMTKDEVMPELKQYHLAPLHHLPEDFQVSYAHVRTTYIQY